MQNHIFSEEKQMMDNDYREVWAKCLDIIRDNLKENEQVFHTWFEPIVPLQLENNVLTIQVPSQFFYEWLEQHFIDLLKLKIKYNKAIGNNEFLTEEKPNYTYDNDVLKDVFENLDINIKNY